VVKVTCFESEGLDREAGLASSPQASVAGVGSKPATSQFMTSQHTIVWIDRKEAKIFNVEPKSFEASHITAPHHHLARKAEEQGQHANNKSFFSDVAKVIKDDKQILLVGPSSAKLDFIRYVHKNNHALEQRIVGMETLDHPTDKQLVAYVRHYFDVNHSPEFSAA